MPTAVRQVLAALGALDPPGPGGDGGEGEGALGRAMQAWRRAREDVIDTLDEFCEAVRQARFEESDKAVILLRAIRANLSAEPSTSRQVAELERYLQTDAVIGHAEMKNGFGITVRIREPLLQALAGLKPLLQA